MGYTLRDGLHFCAVGDQLIFLDLASDRYFGLGDRAAATFWQLARGRNPGNDDLEHLLRSGIIVWQPDGMLMACPALSTPTRSAIDQHDAREDIWLRPMALVAISQIRRDLKRRGFGATIENLRQLKAAKKSEPGIGIDLIAEAAAFAWTARWIRSHDQCLPRSLALARRLMGAGIDANLVIGIRLRPFAAHCWTQTPDMIVNDRAEQVRSYQPILIV